MLNKFKEFLHLNPTIKPEEPLKISVGIDNNKLAIKLDRKVDSITFTKEQLTNLLSAIASQMGNIK